jgi:hypothetical protein
MLRLAALLALLTIIAPAQQQPKQCFAYLKRADVWYQCGASVHQVTHTGRVFGFAVAGGMLALMRFDSSARVLDLSNGRVIERLPRLGPTDPFAIGVFASCDLLFAGWGNPDNYQTIALPDRKPVATLPCVSSRLPKIPDICFLYRASSSGAFLATVTESGNVCVSSASGPPRCGPKKEFAFSVSDAGDVVYDADIHEQCDVNVNGAESPIAAPGRPGVNSTWPNCTGVYLWNPGMPAPHLLARYARFPQWLTPKDLAALARFEARDQAIRP